MDLFVKGVLIYYQQVVLQQIFIHGCMYQEEVTLRLRNQ